MNLSLRSVLPNPAVLSGLADLPRCSNLLCPRPPTLWQRWWARHDGVRLQQAWYCSRDCFQFGLYRHLQSVSLTTRLRTARRNRLPLGLILLSRGEINHRQLRQALELQTAKKAGKVGEWLVSLGAVTGQQVTAALAAQQGCPVFSGENTPLLSERVHWPLPLIRRYHALPVSHNAAAGSLLVGFLETVDHPFLFAVEQMLRCRTQPCILTPSAYARNEELQQRFWPRDCVQIHDRLNREEMTETIGNYAQQAKAEHCHIAWCDDLAWIRLSSAQHDFVDLILRSPAAEA